MKSFDGKKIPWGPITVTVIIAACIGLNLYTYKYTIPPLTTAQTEDIQTKYRNKNQILYRLHQLAVVNSRRVMWTHSFIFAFWSAVILCVSFRKFSITVFLSILSLTFCGLEIPRRFITVHSKSIHATRAGYLHGYALFGSSKSSE